MARIRTIKPEFWVDDVMVELPLEVRLLFIGLWNFADDEGFLEDKPRRIKMQIFPADDVLIEDSLSALCDSGRLHAFDSDQGPLLQVANWVRHQKINRPTPTRFTGITPRNRPSSLSAHDTSVSTHAGKERKGKEGKGSNPPSGGAGGSGKKGSRLPDGWMPTRDDVDAIEKQCPGFDTQREHLNFMDYWQAKPGQAGVKLDWSKTWRGWMRRAYDRLPVQQKPAKRNVRRFNDFDD